MNKNTLFELAFRNDAVGLESAITSGADPNSHHPESGHTPLKVACVAGSEAAVQKLIDCGADPNNRFTWRSRVDDRVLSGRTALMYANDVDIARRLIDAGADVNASDTLGWTPLAIAAESGNARLVEYLVAAGADRNPSIRVDQKSISLLELINGRVAFVQATAGGREPNSVRSRLASYLDVLQALQRRQ
jgi:ankyrin repeat protein